MGSKLRLRVWVMGELVDERWVDAAAPNAGLEAEREAEHQYVLVQQAEAQGFTWAVESWDPDGDVPAVRFGTEATGMLEPKLVDDQQVQDYLRRRSEGRL